MSTHIPAVPAVLNDPLLNHGAAFTAAERKALALTGRLPSAVLTLEEQARRAWQQLQAQPSDLAKNVYTEQLHDRNEVLYPQAGRRVTPVGALAAALSRPGGRPGRPAAPSARCPGS